MSHSRKPKQKHVYGAWRFPDGMNTNDFDWAPCGQVLAECRLERERLEEMWARWLKVKVQLDAEWKAEQQKRIDAIGLEVETARQQQLMDDELKLEQARIRQDHAEIAEMVREYCATFERVALRNQKRRHKAAGRKMRSQDRAAGLEVARKKFEQFKERTHR